MNRAGPTTLSWLILLSTMIYFAGTGFTVNQAALPQDLLVWTVTLIPVFILYRSWSVLLEVSVVPLLWLVLTPYLARQGAAWYLPLVSSTVLLLSHRLRSRLAAGVSLTFIAAWAAFAFISNSMGPVEMVITSTTVVWVVAYFFDMMRLGNRPPAQKVDIILCSMSGNTGHYVQNFVESAEANGINAALHRFHRPEGFKPNLDGDALVLAFPVSGWKPPWPLTEYIWKELPMGKGKPAFILYTSGGGPENAGFVAWMLLTLKGYKVIGRLWGIYPLNVPTFRLGSKHMWRFIDSLTPLTNDLELVRGSAKELAAGGMPGFPVILWPTPLLLIGLLLDNRWVNRFLYRAYVWRRRCTVCNRCVEYCPVSRFTAESGYPKARGTCSLCLGCVNHCPRNAMHIRFWTEYGQQYKSRWPQFVIKK